jgi:hypothetical protein
MEIIVAMNVHPITSQEKESILIYMAFIIGIRYHFLSHGAALFQWPEKVDCELM